MSERLCTQAPSPHVLRTLTHAQRAIHVEQAAAHGREVERRGRAGACHLSRCRRGGGRQRQGCGGRGAASLAAAQRGGCGGGEGGADRECTAACGSPRSSAQRPLPGSAAPVPSPIALEYNLLGAGAKCGFRAPSEARISSLRLPGDGGAQESLGR
jgi:hypothetical protein